MLTNDAHRLVPPGSRAKHVQDFKVIAGDSWGKIAVPVIEHYPATAIIFCAWVNDGGWPTLRSILGLGGVSMSTPDS